MSTRFAFVGFRHAHIRDLLKGVEERPDTEVVACCEEDAATRAALAAEGRVRITHDDFDQMLREVESDVVAIGDYYARRGALAVAALRAGRHVLSDKPICTTLDELAAIERSAAASNRIVGLQLDSRGYGAFRGLRDILRNGDIGEVCTIRIDGQHPLLWGVRPGWYFEPGKHGGTINDIAIHAFDFVPWLTGLSWRGITAARSWNAKAQAAPDFYDCAQVMAVLENGAGVLADFSYLAPDKLGYNLPHYWRILVHGTRGLAETCLQGEEVVVVSDTSTAPEKRAAQPHLPRRYLEDFLNELRGQMQPQIDLTSADCLRASRLTLEAQQLADSGANQQSAIINHQS
jgi:predicted dehydrogenase